MDQVVQPVTTAIALDTLPKTAIATFMEQVGHRAQVVKIHNHLDEEPLAYYVKNLEGVRKLVIDYCLHDTPDTVKLRVKALAKHGVHAITVKAEGGTHMITAALRGAAETNQEHVPQIWVDTIDDTFTPCDLERIYGTRRSKQKILKDLTTLAYQAGGKHVLCPDKEVANLQHFVHTEHMDMEVMSREKLRDTGRFWFESTHFEPSAPTIITALQENFSGKVWVDYKIHNPPDVAVSRAIDLITAGAQVLTIHAAGGEEMIKKVVQVAHTIDSKIKIFVITVLTSLSQDDLALIHPYKTVAEIVLDRALMTKAAGADGVVCSALEVGLLSSHPKLKGWTFVVPGTRYALTTNELSVASKQQSRTATPVAAATDGATMLVFGSQVTNADDQSQAFDRSVAGLLLAKP